MHKRFMARCYLYLRGYFHIEYPMTTNKPFIDNLTFINAKQISGLVNRKSLFYQPFTLQNDSLFFETLFKVLIINNNGHERFCLVRAVLLKP